MIDVFISYRRKTGSEFGSFLYEYLKKDLNYEVFFDYESLREGPFQKKIDEAINQCTYFLLLLSSKEDLERCFESPKTDWVLHEIKLALDSGKIIIPVKIKQEFEAPEQGKNEYIDAVLKNHFCDLSGTNSASLMKEMLPQYMRYNSAREMRNEYNNGITDPRYIEWELNTLKSIYNDVELVKEFGREFPTIIIKGSEEVKFPFESLTDINDLNEIKEEINFKDSHLYESFKKIVGPNVHFPNLYGFASEGYKFDEKGHIKGLKCTPRTYKETVYSCHILHYELWYTYNKLKGERLATLDDLPMRKKIHEGHNSNLEVILSGCNRSSLNDVTIALIDYNNFATNEYEIAVATRSENVATFPGYTGFLPAGGFELYELEDKQTVHTIKKNFNVIGALYREYVEELFGDTDFEKATGDDDRNRLYRNKKVAEIREGVTKGTFQFEFLGVDFDLVTLRQTLVFVLRIDDDHFGEKEFHKNSENTSLRFIPLSELEEEMSSLPIMVESAGVYALLKQHKTYKEIVDNNYKLLRK